MCEFRRNSTWDTRYARLHEAAQDMYELLNSMCSYIHELQKFFPHFPDALSLWAKQGEQLLARIDGNEDNDD